MQSCLAQWVERGYDSARIRVSLKASMLKVDALMVIWVSSVESIHKTAISQKAFI